MAFDIRLIQGDIYVRLLGGGAIGLPGADARKMDASTRHPPVKTHPATVTPPTAAPTPPSAPSQIPSIRHINMRNHLPNIPVLTLEIRPPPFERIIDLPIRPRPRPDPERHTFILDPLKNRIKLLVRC